MHSDASALAPPSRAGDGDVDDPPRGRQQVPERGGAPMTEYRSVAASEHSRKPDAFLAQSPVADGIDAAMDSMEATRLDAARNGALGDANRDQLGKQDSPVLAGRDARDLAIRVPGGAFWTHTV